MDDLTPSQRKKVMRRIKSSNTRAEVVLRKALWHAGYRYRKNYAKLPGKPDIVLTKQKICIFVDGEYFHGRGWEDDRKDRVAKGTNASYWIKKIQRNIERDDENDADLRGRGWTVLRFWSRDILKDPDTCFRIIEDVIFQNKIENS